MEHPEFIQTRASQRHKKHDEFTVVEYVAYKPKPKKVKVDTKPKLNGIPFDPVKARHEMMKFSVDGLDGGRKELAKEQIAIKLGAKAPKREYINYKQLLEQKKSEKQLARERLKNRTVGHDVYQVKNEDLARKALPTYHYKKAIHANGGKANILGQYGVVKKQELKNEKRKGRK